MNRRDAVARFRVDSSEWSQFVAFCQARDITPSQALRGYVRRVIGAEPHAGPLPAETAKHSPLGE